MTLDPFTDRCSAIRLTNGGVTYVDSDLFWELCRFKWRRTAQGYACAYMPGDGRGRRGAKGHYMLLQRYVLGLRKGDAALADHKNRDRLDNRRCNLRVTDHAGNALNVSSRGGTSQYRGVSWDKRRGLWIAQATVGGEHHFLGRHEDEHVAGAVVEQFWAKHIPDLEIA